MKRNLTLFRGARLGLLALSLPLLSACYSTVGYDGRTMLRPLSSPGPYYSTATLTPPVYRPPHLSLVPIGSYRSVQGYTYYTPTPMGMSHYTIPATLGFTSFPLVSRRLVSIDGVCIVEAEQVDDCD
jgi:hypothetical protein